MKKSSININPRTAGVNWNCPWWMNTWSPYSEWPSLTSQIRLGRPVLSLLSGSQFTVLTMDWFAVIHWSDWFNSIFPMDCMLLESRRVSVCLCHLRHIVLHNKFLTLNEWIHQWPPQICIVVWNVQSIFHFHYLVWFLLHFDTFSCQSTEDIKVLVLKISY